MNREAKNLKEIKEYYKSVSAILMMNMFREVSRQTYSGEGGDYMIVYYKERGSDKLYMSLYLSTDMRGQGRFKNLYETYGAGATVITSSECELTSYLRHVDIPFRVIETPKPYKAISEYYAGKETSNGVPYINHINEGIEIIDMISKLPRLRYIPEKCIYIAMMQYCIHPIYQNSDNGDVESNELTYLYDDHWRELGDDYAKYANGYLSKRVIDSIDDIDFPTKEHTILSLLADKIQNHKDFILHNQFEHKGRRRLFIYFMNWFEKFEKELVITPSELKEITNKLLKR